MGVAGSPDIFQEKMTSLMSDLEYVRAYIDDLLIFSKDSFKDHLTKVEKVKEMHKAGLKVSCTKSTFGVDECKYLGYVLTRQGIKPQSKKIKSILAINPHQNVKELRSFLSIVQYYRDLWGKRSEMLAPLTDLIAKCGETKATKDTDTKKSPWHWYESHQKAFDDVKKIVGLSVILSYPDYLQPFSIYTDASTRQLGAVFVQNIRPIVFLALN